MCFNKNIKTNPTLVKNTTYNSSKSYTNNTKPNIYFPIGRSIMTTKHDIEEYKIKKGVKKDKTRIRFKLELKKIRLKNEIISLNVLSKDFVDLNLGNEKALWSILLSVKIDISDEKEYKIKNDIVLDYFFEKEQIFKFEFDFLSEGGENLNNHNSKKKGKKSKEVNIASILSSGNLPYCLNIDNNFTLNIKSLNPEPPESLVELDVFVIHTKPIGKELFYVLSHTHDEEGELTKVFKSEEIFPGDSNDWIFSKVSLPKNYLAFDDNQKIQIQIMEFDDDHYRVNEKFQGFFTVNDVLKGVANYKILTEEIKGTLKINIKEFKLSTFIDYVSRGMSINLITAIDYTGSNGHPMDETSLHYLKSKEPTQYEKAIRACGNILAPYDDDQMIPVYGFGGVPPNKILVEHVFSISIFVKNKRLKSSNFNNTTKRDGGKKNRISSSNSNSKNKNKKELEEKVSNLERGIKSVKSIESDIEEEEQENNSNSNQSQSNNLSNNDYYKNKLKEEKEEKNQVLFKEDSVFGLEGVIEAYKNSISKVIFSGPTNFSPLIDKVKNNIRHSLSFSSLNYYILLIITDGQINDLKQTINSIVMASDLPLSIVIVGVGDDDFNSMTELDGDDFPLTNYNNRVTARDIVQFVPFNKYKDNMKILGQEILKEVPLQVESYFQFSNSSELIIEDSGGKNIKKSG